MTTIRDNPSDRATIAVLCPYIFFAQAYAGLVRQLPQSEIIPDYTARPAGTIFSDERKREFREWLSQHDLPWRDIEFEKQSAANFFAKYGTVVAPYYGGWVRNPALKSHRKARVFYGAAKDIWGFSLWNSHFDLICTPGPYFTDTLNELYGRYGTRAVSTGEPKLDDVLTTSVNDARTQLNIGSKKPVILVQPTWGRLSSLHKIAASLVSLSDRYTIMVKAHHRSSAQEPETFKAFNGTNIRVIDQTTPVPVALAAADVVISDGSGAIFDALRADKPLVVIDTIGIPDDEFYIETYYGQREEKLAGMATYGASTEQRIKRFGSQISPIVDVTRGLASPEQLEEAVENAICNAGHYARARAALMESHFVPIDGKASERVAREIAQLAQTKKLSPTRSQHLFSVLVTDYFERAKHEERILASSDYEINARLADKMRAIKTLPYSERIRSIIHEFFE